MKVFVAGDYGALNRIEKSIEENDYTFFNEVREITKDYDFSIVNLEVPIVSKDARPIKKCGGNLKTLPNVIESLQYGRFNVVTLANNHIMDYGPAGLKETELLLDKAKIKHIGTGKNLEDAGKILYLDKEGQKLAIINCCEHEFSIAEYNKPGANPLNPIHQYNAIKEAQNKADYILVIVHGGHEHWQLPSPRMVETYRFFIDAGADAVVNHHQHCYSGYEVYKGKPIFYGIGNLCFDSKNEKDTWNEGYAVGILFNKSISFNIYPLLQCKENGNVHFLMSDAFQNKINDLNEIIKDQEKLREKTESYYKSFKSQIDETLQPYNSRILKKLYSLNLLPRLFRGSKLKNLENLILCESHRDKISYFFKHIK